MKNSKLKQHDIINKELVPPFMKGEMGEKIVLHSWSRQRLPEYLWIGLLRDSCETRKEYFDKMLYFKEYILSNFEDDIGKFSTILNLNSDKKTELFETIKDYFGDKVLDSLLVVSYFDIELRNSFRDENNTNDDRIKKIKDVVDKMYDRYSEVAMDVRYMVIIFRLNKLKFPMGDNITVEAIQKYPNTLFDSEIIKMYTSILSSLEGMDFADNNDYNYSKYFYEEMYLMTECNEIMLCYDNDNSEEELKKVIKQLRELLIKSNEINYDDKRDVIVGNLSYIYKIISEIYNSNLGDSIVSRLVMRSLVEIYANLKYICKKSIDEPKIWESFKDYGSGKYKNIYKKIEEGVSNDDVCKHLNKDLLRIFANENKSEEFIKIKFSNFADKNVRQKFIDIDEKNLYDTYYDYDTCFSHGYWGAIRESSLLFCDNSLHNYHTVADSQCQQKLPNIYQDYIYILNKIIVIVNEEIGVK